MRLEARGQVAFSLDETANGAVEAVPRHTEIPNVLASANVGSRSDPISGWLGDPLPRITRGETWPKR